MAPESSALAVAIITAIIGPIVTYFVTQRRRNDVTTSDAGSYGIKIIYPGDDPVTEDWVEVRGLYSRIPPHDTLRLFVVSSDRTSDGERFWPQGVVREFFPDTKTWRCKINTKKVPIAGGAVIAAVVGQPTIVLWNYYYKIGRLLGWYDFEGWPSDSKVCDRVSIRRSELLV